MNVTPTHTPLPWNWRTSNSHFRLTGSDGKDGGVISATRASDGMAVVSVHPDDAAFIVQACNAHPKVVEVLKAIRDLLKEDRHIPLVLVEAALLEAGEPI